jgi:hypothetical protein
MHLKTILKRFGLLPATQWFRQWSRHLVRLTTNSDYRHHERSVPLNLRLILRRLVHRLPPSWQLHLADVKSVLLHRHDWASPIKRLRLRERNYFEETALKNSQFPDRKRIFFWSLQKSPPWLEIEYVLATALRLRGHDVRGVLCDGLLPICERNLGPQERPPCAVCFRRLARYEEAFGFDFARLTEFISIEDCERAEGLVARTPTDDLPALVVKGVRVGRLARSELHRYYRGFIFDPLGEALPAYRQWLVAGVLLIWLFERVLDHTQPDILITSCGKKLLAACAYELARLRGIHVVTWDTSPLYPNGLELSHNKPAVEVHLEDVWAEVSKQDLSNKELTELDKFMRRWSRSEITPFPYNPRPMEDEQIIRQQLGLRPQSPTVVAFTNTSWDMAVVDRDIGFESMYDWIFSLVQYAIIHPEIDLIMRAHPAEKKVPSHLKSRTLVVAEIRKRYESLPSNIKFIEGDSPISSYTLGEMAQVATLYTGMLGLEFALRGKRPWIAGDVTFRGKGFTLDLASRENMYALLDKNLFDNQLSEEEVKLAQRFAYLWIFRHVFRNPFVKPADNHFSLGSFRALAPGGHPVIEDLCEALLAGKPFIDIGHANSNR